MTRFDQIEHASLTDVGVRRSHNQDNYSVQLAPDADQWQQRGHLFLVADGMGAHAVGEKASEQAAAVIPHAYHKHAQEGPVAALRKAFVEANASIHACGQANREFEGMGTTASGLLLRPEGAWIGHVGDSRVYRVRAGFIEQLTYDHSLVWEYARLKRLDPDEVRDIPSNVIHRCLGPEPLVKVDVEGPHPILPGDLFLLCSDGLSGQVSDAEMGAVAAALPPAEACRFLVDLANLRGGPDNVTVLIARVPGETPPDGSAQPAPARPSGPPPWARLPWWVWTLTLGAVLAFLALSMTAILLPGAEYPFTLGAIAILVGLFGMGRHYLREKEQAEADDEQPQPRVHRRHACAVDATLVDRIARAARTLRQRLDDRQWETDWQAYEEHLASAEALQAKGDLDGSFRAYCRALLPLTRTLSKYRQKEEAFTPVWDKSR